MFKSLAALILILGTTTTFAAAPKATVMVRPESEVSDSCATLGGIATLKCTDAEFAARLRKVPVCTSLFPGRTRPVTREQVVIALRKAGIRDESVDLLSPPKFQVARSSSTVTGEALLEAAKEFVMVNIPANGRVEIQPVRIPMDQIIPIGKLQLKVQSITGGTVVHKGHNNLRVDMVVDEQSCGIVSIPLKVRIYIPILVSIQGIARAGEITSANVKIEERDTANLPSDVMTEMPSAGSIAVNTIPSGAGIRRAWVTAPTVIHSGDAVTVIVQGESIRVCDKGTAAQDGRVGDRIRIRCTGNSREVTGIITEPGIVTISMAGRS